MGAGTTGCRQAIIGLRLTCRVERSLTEANVRCAFFDPTPARDHFAFVFPLRPRKRSAVM